MNPSCEALLIGSLHSKASHRCVAQATSDYTLFSTHTDQKKQRMKTQTHTNTCLRLDKGLAVRDDYYEGTEPLALPSNVGLGNIRKLI